ncbi:MAG: biotin--[acetyl-CoA-carboxylase] ligase [Planctomycetes bacterium]|nr:biotin--[acetyl-CoA-carboxylase] ligase [Planctomycetota bacterium]
MTYKNPTNIWKLDHKLIGKLTWHFEEIDSTSNHAANQSHEKSNDGLAIIAESQTYGRGQHGRVWNASKGQSVLLSVLLFPPDYLRRPAILTAWAAVAVCNTIQDFLGLRASIKWPNDILLDGRKISGILIEQSTGTIVGIGLNILQTSREFTNLGLPFATSMQQFTPHPLNTHEIAKRLLSNLDEIYHQLLDGNLQMLEKDWVSGIGLLGREVMLEEHGKKHKGKLTHQSFAHLNLESEMGIKQQFVPENILHLSEFNPYAESQP